MEPQINTETKKEKVKLDFKESKVCHWKKKKIYCESVGKKRFW